MYDLHKILLMKETRNVLAKTTHFSIAIIPEKFPRGKIVKIIDGQFMSFLTYTSVNCSLNTSSYGSSGDPSATKSKGAEI